MRLEECREGVWVRCVNPDSVFMGRVGVITRVDGSVDEPYLLPVRTMLEAVDWHGHCPTAFDPEELEAIKEDCDA